MNRQFSAITWLGVTAAMLSASGRLRLDRPRPYTPTSDEARGSLETALTAWRDGKPCGPIEASLADPGCRLGLASGQQIESFEIGDEKDDGDGTKQFAVKLKMKKPARRRTVRYFVHGRDPVWVYREEDYKRMINMDNNPEPARPARSRGAAIGQAAMSRRTWHSHGARRTDDSRRSRAWRPAAVGAASWPRSGCGSRSCSWSRRSSSAAGS